jgi:hypothetical protein
MAFPGVPALFNSALSATGSLPLLEISDALGLQNILSAQQWAINDANGNAVIQGESFISIEYESDASISDYPVENGAFVSYNKVQNPYTLKVTVALSGSASIKNLIQAAQATSISGAFASLTGTSARGQFLSSIATTQLSLGLLSVVTPDATYNNLNLVHADYDRSATAGAALLQVNLWFEEVRVNAASAYSNTVSTNGANPVNTGTTQPVSPTLSQSGGLTASGVA